MCKLTETDPNDTTVTIVDFVCLFDGVQYYVIKFVCDLRQVGGFFRVLRFPRPIKMI
jgi:hypothetical protein